MNQSHIQFYDFKDHPVRIVDSKGEPWWVAKDVCGVLGLENNREAVSKLDDDELTSVTLTSGGQGRTMTIINESGLYSLILRSNKPEAKAFKRWVTREVLPSLRRTGTYSMQPEIPPAALVQLPADTSRDFKRTQVIQMAMQKPTQCPWGIWKGQIGRTYGISVESVSRWLYEGVPGMVPDIPEGVDMFVVVVRNEPLRMSCASFAPEAIQWLADRLAENLRQSFATAYRALLGRAHEENWRTGGHPSLIRHGKRIRNFATAQETGIKICG